MSPADAPVNKIRSLADLTAIKERTQADTALREDGYHVRCTVHMGTCGIASGARAVLAAAMEELAASGRLDVRVTTSGCIGACEHEPEMTVEVLDAEPVLYGDLDAEKTRAVFRQHVLAGTVVPEYAVSLGDHTGGVDAHGRQRTPRPDAEKWS
jgi:NADP-reducing hydrogenase subunit HndB